MNETLYKALAKRIYRLPIRPGKHKEIRGLDQIDKVIDIDHPPIGRTPRSNPATYTGLFTPLNTQKMASVWQCFSIFLLAVAVR